MMRKHFWRLLLVTAILFVAVFFLNAVTATAQISKLNPITNPSLDELRENFKNPHRDFSTGPLWTWNDRLTDEQVRGTLRDLAGQHVRQVWVHPRPGLMTPYLSDEWFARWKTALDEAEKLDMNVWIYDENSYPSGFAGGFVPEALPDSRGKGLHLQRVKELADVGDAIWYVYKITTDEAGAESFENVTAWAKEQKRLPAGNWLIGKIQLAGGGGWFGGWWYVDLLKQGVTEKFIEITLEPYRKRFGDQFGKRIPGWFTDEPHLQAAGGLTWNEEIPQLFEKKFGYSLIDNLPSLASKTGDWKKVRHNYQQLLLDLFIERWSKPCYDYCEKYGLQFTGHYWEHGWPGAGHGPDNMAMYAWHQRPAIDLLMNTYNDKSPNAQFGNVRSVKELASVANQMGHSRTLSENYGAGGWDIRFEDLKRLGDWSYALGVNTNNEHLSYVTIKGARKRDHPQSFSYHASWFEGYHVLADYFTRLSYILSQGRQVNHVVVIEPTTTAWMYQGTPELGKIGQSFTDFVNALEHNHVEYDLASEDIIKRFGKIDGKDFIIGQAKYDKVILPQNVENLNKTTVDLLLQFVENGGQLFCVDKWFTHIDGVETKSHFNKNETAGLKNLFDRGKLCSFDEGVRHAGANSPFTYNYKFTLHDAHKNLYPDVFLHRRRTPDYEIVFICNTNLARTANIQFVSSNFRLEEYNLLTGEITNLNCSPRPTWLTNQFECHFYETTIPPAGSRLFVIDGKRSIARDTNVNKTTQIEVSALSSTMRIRRLEDNVLTLDYVDVKVGDEERKDIYTWAANRFVFQKHGMGGNPWDNQVQFKDKLITKKFPDNSGFEATYHFMLQESIPNNLAIVIERPDLYKIYCNDKEVKAVPNVWWLDKSFGKIDLSKVAKIGANNVNIVAQPMTIEHELEPAYLLGNFSLQNADKGFIVVPPQALTMKLRETADTLKHNEEIEGVAWLSAGVGFRSNKQELVDRSPTLEFDFGTEQKIDAIRIWNYNERNLKQRGAKTVEITGLDKIDLPIGDGSAYELPFNSPQKFKTISFKILENYNGSTYPIPENAQPKDNGFVGLAEVQFYTKQSNKLVPIKNVTVKASSELVIDSHDRKAEYLIDGSGLGQIKPTWNQQGMPFYAGKVEYSQTFNIEKFDSSKKYFVPIPPSRKGWYGSTAQVVVNGQSAGFVITGSSRTDVTKFIKDGQNEISVIVYGTPKNLLGPHHAGELRGSAWPGSFHRAPEHQPPGANYDTIGYGLFEPFGLFLFGK